jgi:hypothetical protein
MNTTWSERIRRQVRRAALGVYFAGLHKESEARRAEHPDWPSHKQTTFYPDGTEETLVTTPVKKIEGGTAYCKYCYQTHRNWWLMDQRDYDVEGHTIILCGQCEYTSSATYAELEMSQGQAP